MQLHRHGTRTNGVQLQLRRETVRPTKALQAGAAVLTRLLREAVVLLVVQPTPRPAEVLLRAVLSVAAVVAVAAGVPAAVAAVGDPAVAAGK